MATGAVQIRGAMAAPVDGRQIRLRNLDFELAFGDTSDDGRGRTYQKHVRGAQSEPERREMFAHMYTSLTWGGRANVTRFFGGQRPAHVPAFDAAVRSAFAGRAVPAYEVTSPVGGQPSKGVVLAIHGGGWVMVGPGALRAMDGDVLRWNERGYTVVNVDYRAGAASVDDALAFYDAIRRWQPHAKVGATGQSAGGHLSMMIAAQRSDLDFVVSLAGPSDLVHLNEGTERSRQLKEGVDRLWNPAGQVANSPALQAGRMGARMLLGTGARDELVPPMQDERMRRARPDLVQTMVLAPGDRPFIHAGVSDADYAAFFQREAELAERA